VRRSPSSMDSNLYRTLLYYGKWLFFFNILANAFCTLRLVIYLI